MSNTFSLADIKLCIFDLDGTLVDTIGDLAGSVDFALMSLGYEGHTLDEYKSFVGDGTKLLVRRALPNNVSDDIVDKAHSIFTKHYSEHYCDSSRIYDGVEKAVERLKSKGVTLAVNTNKPDTFAKGIIEKLFGKEVFCEVVGSMDNVPKKPDPSAVLKIISALQVKSEECLYIGDSEVDVMTAHNAGIKCVGCAWGFRSVDCLENSGADFVVNEPEEILKLFSKNG